MILNKNILYKYDNHKINKCQKDYFQFLWLQYVTGVNLKKHCKPCLKGKSSIHITPKMTSAHDIKLDEKECKYYYLCGVSKGNKLDKNFHLAFKEKKII